MITVDAVKKSVIDAGIIKEQKNVAIEAVTVQTIAGNMYDGNRASRQALTTAVALGSTGETVAWKLADNSIAVVTYEELKEALRLIGEAHTAIVVS